MISVVSCTSVGCFQGLVGYLFSRRVCIELRLLIQ